MFYRLSHVLVSILAKLCFRLRVYGAEHIPKGGGLIVAANHNSYFDIPLLGCALPRPADNIAKVELFRNPLIAALFRALGGFPVRRGSADRRAMDEAVQRVKSGRLLAYYPEGTRSQDGQLQKGKAGIGRVVALSGAVVVPAYIDGTAPVRLFHRVTVHFGAPLDFSGEIIRAKNEGVHPKILYDTISTEIMTQIGRLAPKAPAAR